MGRLENNWWGWRVVLILAFVGIRLCNSSAMGPVPWLYVAEIVQPNLVPWCSLLNWTMFGVISTLFPVVC